MSSNYIGLNGIVTESYQESLDNLKQSFRSIYGANVNLEQNTSDGQWLAQLAQQKQDMLDLMVQYYNNLDVDRVVGIPQQILYKLNGLTIKAYNYSYCYVTVNVTSPVNLQGLDDDIDNQDGVGYTVADQNGNEWILAESQNLAVGSHVLNFRASLLGSITCTPNSINTMITIVRGVSSVNNDAVNYITGATGESDSQFRTRRNRCLAVPSQGFDDSIESQMLNLSNVTDCKVYDNREDTIVNGIPAHTVWIIVRGGLQEEIGRVIYANLPPGIPMKGEQHVSVVKTNGKIQVVNYDIPTAVDLYIKVDIKNFTSTALDLDYIKQELSKISFSIGEMAQSVNLLTSLKDIIGETGMPYDLQVSVDGISYVEYVSPTGLDEYFTLKSNNINIMVS